MRKRSIAATVLSVASGLTAIGAGTASAADVSVMACAPKDDAFDISQVTTGTRPTNTYSAYITGPGTITYNQTKSTTVGASLSASATAEAGVIIAKASTTIGVSLTASRTWTSGFSYSLTVPSGKTRRMRLMQESRVFYVTKRTFDVGACNYKTVYSGSKVNAPRKARVDKWVLEA